MFVGTHPHTNQRPRHFPQRSLSTKTNVTPHGSVDISISVPAVHFLLLFHNRLNTSKQHLPFVFSASFVSLSTLAILLESPPPSVDLHTVQKTKKTKTNRLEFTSSQPQCLRLRISLNVLTERSLHQARFPN
jgi:hypothetical protein